MKLLLLIFIVFSMSPLFSEEIIIEKLTSDEWQIQVPKDFARGRAEKILCIGNEDFLIKFPITNTSKFTLKNRMDLKNGDLFYSFAIKLGTLEGVFLLPSYGKYYMFEKMVVHPGKKNVWISNVMPQTKVYSSFFGESLETLDNKAKPYFIYIWEDSPSKNYEKYYQNKVDALKIGNVMKKCNSFKDFIEYDGPVYLSPLMSVNNLRLCGNCQSCGERLEALQFDLSWEVLCFNQGLSDIDPVLMSCKKLFDFYLQHSKDEKLSDDLCDKIKKLVLMMQQQKSLKFKHGVAN